MTYKEAFCILFNEKNDTSDAKRAEALDIALKCIKIVNMVQNEGAAL